MEQVELIGLGALLVLLFGIFIAGLAVAVATGLGSEALHGCLRRVRVRFA